MGGMAESKFRAHQHSQSASKNPDVVQVGSLYGDHKEGSGGVTHATGNVVQVPYAQRRNPRKPGDSKTGTPRGPGSCGIESCGGYATMSGLCAGHSRSQQVEAPRGDID